MNLDFQQHLPAAFNDHSRVWIYQSDRLLQGNELQEINELLHEFVQNWDSHGAPVKGYAKVLFGKFIILMADESHTAVSGCSTDSSVRLMKELEAKFNTELFNRQSLAFLINDQIEQISMPGLQTAFENKRINEETLYFNNTITTKRELIENWIIPIKKSWISKQLILQ